MAEVHARTRALLDRVAAAVDADGRLALPDVATWDIFPFEGEILVRRLEAPVVPEPPRHGEGGDPCGTCAAGDTRAIWADEHWKLVPLDEAPIPIVLLEPMAHLDLADLDDAQAAELGVLTVRVERALAALGGVGRVHVMKVGDGSSHLHVWFLARPEGLLQLRGSSLSDWSDCLPPMPPDEWLAIQHELAVGLVQTGGRALR
jgi:diadenosine tetraphosphate (Ap4A) HIT family hydrolase